MNTNSNNSSIISKQSNIKRSYKYESERLLFGQGWSDQYSQDLRTQATPSWVAEDMVDLLPDEVWRTDSKFLDIYCKSGIFIEVIMNRLLKKVDYSTIGLTDKYEIIEYIRKNQVYAICWTRERVELARTVINGKVIKEYNVALLEKNDRYIKEEPLGFDKFVKETFSNMQFDVVIGNPPYNNDLYLDFVQIGHKLASKCDCWITPAKWQAKGGEKNEAFRNGGYVTVKKGGKTTKEYWDAIVPHMSKIVYYPDCLDVFGISEHSGISYYILDKGIHNEKEIVNKCNQVKYFNNVYNRGINRESTLYNIGDNIHKKFTYKVISMKKIYNCTKKYLVHTNKLTAGPGHFSIKEQNKNGKWVLKHDVIGNGGFKFNVNTHDTNVVSECEIIENTQADIYMLSGSRVIIFESDSIDECKSFISFIDTKIVRFLVLIGIFQQDIINDESWRFVPDPGPFDRIFEDKPLQGYTPDINGEYVDANGNKHCSLYVKYNLTQEEINIIESVIKERK